MARPRKEGMDYFPHDTDASGDEKIEALRALYGNDGYAFYFILLERIYRTPGGELDISKPALLASTIKKIGVSKELFEDMLETSLDVELFNKEAFERKQVLTSMGVKKRIISVNELRDKWRKKTKGKPQDNLEDNSHNQRVFPGENPRENHRENQGENRGDNLGENLGDNPTDNPRENLGDNSGENPGKTPESKRKENKSKEKSLESLKENLALDVDKGEVIDYYCQKVGRLALSEKDRLRLDEVLAIPGITAKIIKQGIDLGMERFCPNYPGHKINGFGYFVSLIQELMAKEVPSSGQPLLKQPVSNEGQKKIINIFGYQVELNITTGACRIGGTTYMNEETCRNSLEIRALMEKRGCS